MSITNSEYVRDLIKKVMKSQPVKIGLRGYTRVNVCDLHDITRGSQWFHPVRGLSHHHRNKLARTMNMWLAQQRGSVDYKTNYNPCSEIQLKGPQFAHDFSKLEERVAAITCKAPEMYIDKAKGKDHSVHLDAYLKSTKFYQPSPNMDLLAAGMSINWGDHPNDGIHQSAEGKAAMLEQHRKFITSNTCCLGTAEDVSAAQRRANFEKWKEDFAKIYAATSPDLKANTYGHIYGTVTGRFSGNNQHQSNQPKPEKEMSTATKYYVNGQDVSHLSEGNLVDTINVNDQQIEYNKKQIDTYKEQIDKIKAANTSLVEDNRVIKGHIASKRGKTVTKATPTAPVQQAPVTKAPTL